MSDAKVKTLPVGAHAEPNTCGSCKYFWRRTDYNQNNGECQIELPPMLRAAVNRIPYDDESGSARYTDDNRRCDLYRSDGVTYIVQREIKPCS